MLSSARSTRVCLRKRGQLLRRFSQGRIAGQGDGGLDRLDTAFDHRRPTDIVGPEEGLQAVPASTLCGSEVGPLFDEAAEHPGVSILEPVEDLRVVVFQGGREAVGIARLVRDQGTALLDQAGQGPVPRDAPAPRGGTAPDASPSGRAAIVHQSDRPWRGSARGRGRNGPESAG